MMVVAAHGGIDRGVLEREVAEEVGKVRGQSASAILDQMAAHPSHDLAVPSPVAVAAIGPLCGRYGIRLTPGDIRKSKTGECCSMSLLLDILERKLSAKTP